MSKIEDSGDSPDRLRRGHYELAIEVPPQLRLAAAFTELAQVISGGNSGPDGCAGTPET